MSKNLVIVESPAKAKTIGRYLGKDFRITASVGHIRDLPSSKMGVDVENGYQPQYVSMKGKEKVIHELKDMAKSADRIYIATDPDREGEAIAWHLAQLLNVDSASDCRIAFNEITRPAVLKALDHPRPIDMNLVNSQQARRILDRLVGYELSPLLWKKVKKGLSAGRVQSVATRMVVDREREIDAFKPEEYWLIHAFLQKTSGDPEFRARYHGVLEEGRVRRRKLSHQDDAAAVETAVKQARWTVRTVKKGRKQRKAGAPFTTSTLQQEASRYLSFTSRRTMVVAQQLYEGLDLPKIGTTALVTYIRTDSVRVSTEAEQEARQYITRVFGEAYLPKTANHYRNRNASQDAHEAIRPAHFDLPPEQIRDQLSNDQYRLYKLIWDKFMSSQMAPAQVDTVTADIEANGQIFRVSGETIVFPGYLAQYGVQLVDQEAEKPADDEDDSKNRLPELAEGDELMLNRLTSEQKFTLPPPRYTEATLIRAMEEKGIGRPSTYAPTISTILDRFYVEKEQRFLKPTELGKAVTGMLEEQFDDIVDLAFTADMEERLDTVESGEVDWVRILDQFYPPFHQKVQDATETMERVKIAVTPTGESCPECNDGDLVIKEGRFGKFIACSNYPECKYTRNIENAVKGVCPLCGSGLVSRVSKKYRGSRFYTCDRKGKDPECAFISWDIPIEDSHCETCGSYMVWKRYRGRTFPKCGNRDCPTNEKRRKKDDSGDDTAAAAAAGDKAVTAKKPAAKKTAATKRSATTTAKKSITAKKVTTAKKSTTAKKPTTAKKTTAAKKATTAKKAAGTKKKKTTEPVVPDVSSGEGETL